MASELWKRAFWGTLCLCHAGCSVDALQGAPVTLTVTPDRLVFSLPRPGVATDQLTLRAKGHGAVMIQSITLSPRSQNTLAMGELPAMPYALGAQEFVLDVTFESSQLGFTDEALMTIVSDSGTVEVPIEMTVELAADYDFSACPEPRHYEPAVLWKWEGLGAPNHTSTRSLSGIAVGNLSDDNGDGHIDTHDTPDVVFITYASTLGRGVDTVLRSISGDTGQLQWSKAYNLRFGSFPAIADIDGDGAPEILAMGDVGALHDLLIAFDNKGNELWHSAFYEHDDTGHSVIQVVDMDADGTPEIVVGNTVFNNDGTLKWQGLGSSGSYNSGSSSFATDLDGDGLSELVAGGTAYSHDGTIRWDHSELKDGPVAVADCDGDGTPEIFFSTGHIDYVSVSIIEHDGSIRVANKPTAYSAKPSLPCAGDLDGDGSAEWIVAYEETLAVFDCNGNLSWDVPVFDRSSFAGPIVFDFEGDGRSEIVYADEFLLYIIRDQGEIVFEALRSSVTQAETPVVADVNNDGHAEILVQNTNGFTSHPDIRPGIIAYTNAWEDWAGTLRVWNQGSFVGNNTDEFLAIPSDPLPHWQVANMFRGTYALCDVP